MKSIDVNINYARACNVCNVSYSGMVLKNVLKKTGACKRHNLDECHLARWCFRNRKQDVKRC